MKRHLQVYGTCTLLVCTPPLTILHVPSLTLHLALQTHEGCSGLFDLVHKSNGLDEALVKNIVAQVICVLHYLHQKVDETQT
jgi:hypothetical protein